MCVGLDCDWMIRCMSSRANVCHGTPLRECNLRNVLFKQNIFTVVRHRKIKPNSSIELKEIPNAEEEEKATLSRINQASGACNVSLNHM